MLFIGILCCAVVLYLVIKYVKYNKDDEVCDICEPEDEIPCVVLKKLQVLYAGRFLASGEVVEVPYNTNVKFEVKGFDVTGTKEACIDGSEVMWLKSCDVVHWTFNEGLTNSVLVSNKTVNVVRNVWVKCGSLTFQWKIKVV